MEGTLLELQGLVTHQIYHKRDLLSEEDFRELVQHKEKVIGKGEGAITIHTDGSITVDNNKKENFEDSNHFFSYLTSKESVVNLNYDIENFVPVLGEPFAKVLSAVKKFMLEQGIKNPKPYSVRAYRNNKVIRWHRHTMPTNVHRKNFYVGIYYLHPNWDTSFGGALKIGLSDQETLLLAPCYSNSLVLHNGYYGHGVDELKLGYEGNRDIFLNHWITD